MQALTLSTSRKDRQALDSKCREWLTRAEKLKEQRDRKLTTREEIILLEGAKLNGFVFPPWVAPPAVDEFEGQTYWYALTDCPIHSQLVSSRLIAPPVNANWNCPLQKRISLMDGNGHVSCFYPRWTLSCPRQETLTSFRTC